MGSNALNDRRASVDVVLTNLSIGIPTDQDFIGDRLLPPLPIGLSTVKFPKWGTEAFRIREDRVGDYSTPELIDISMDTVSVEVDGHALAGAVSDRHQIESQQGPLKVDLDFEVLQTIVSNMDLAREKQQADLLSSTAIYSAANKVDVNGVSNLWDDSNNDPLTNIVPMLETTVPDASGRRPNLFWMGQPVWAGLMYNEKLRARAYGTVGPVPTLTLQKFADLIQIPTVLVGRAISRTSAGVVTKLWGKNAGMLWVPPTGGRRIPAFGYTVEQTVFGGASEQVIRVRDEMMGASGGEKIKRSAFYTASALFVDAGSLFYNAVA